MRLSSCARKSLLAWLLVPASACNIEGDRADSIVVNEVQVCGAAEPAPKLAPLPAMDQRHKAFFGRHPLATVIDQGGPKLTAPRVIAVFFGDDPLQGLTEDFLRSYGCTRQWRDAVNEYGIGDVHYLRSLIIPAYPDIKDNLATAGLAFAEWVKTGLDAGTFGKLEEQDLLLFFAPPSAERAAANIGGYHSEVPAKGPSADPLQSPWPDSNRPMAVVYANPEDSGRYALDDRTAAASHELIEASTDPYPGSKPALASFVKGLLAPSNASNDWQEIADFCAKYDTSLDYPFAVSHAYSNRRARVGRDPCFPDDPIKAMVAPHNNADAVNLSPHPERPLVLDLFADDPDTRFQVTVANLIVMQHSGITAWVDIEQKSQVLKSGGRAEVALNLLTLPPWLTEDEVASGGHVLQVGICPDNAPDSADCVYQNLPVDHLPPFAPAEPAP